MLFSEIKSRLNEIELPEVLETSWMVFGNLPLAVRNRIERIEQLIIEHGASVNKNPEANSIKSELIHIINHLTDNTT